MKRDMDLIRDLLLRVEKDPDLDGFRYVDFDAAEFPGHSANELRYHTDLLMEAGLVIGVASGDGSSVARLTWEGHEFLASVHDAGIWAKVKERAKGLPELTFALAWELAKAELRKRLGL
jgi:hypothetical protein